MGALVLTGGGTRQKEQLFSLPFWRGTLRNGLGRLGEILLKSFISKTKLPKNVKQPDSYEVNFNFGVKTRFLDENGCFFHISADLN
jgi:hypothetical protein